MHRLNNASGFHIGAFERRGELAVPVMQYVTNIYHLDMDTGVYSDLREYRSEENFPSHPNPGSSWTGYPANQLRHHLREFERGHGFPHWFRNGDLAFSARPWEGMRDAVNSLRGDLRHCGLKAPEDLRLWNALAKTIVRQTRRLTATRRSSARIATCRATVSGSPIPSSARPAITEPIESGPEANKLPRWTSASVVTSPQTSSPRRARNFEASAFVSVSMRSR